MKIHRKKTRQITVGGLQVGGSAPIAIQSMTNTHTYDVKATVSQITCLVKAGCEVVRVSVPDHNSALAIKEIKRMVDIPIIADIHFDYQMALSAIESGVDGIRINPGNIKKADIEKLVMIAKDSDVAMRVGINAGSLEKDLLQAYGHPTPEALVESALRTLEILQKKSFYKVKISVKASSVGDTIDAYRLLAKKTDFPLHIGVSEAGPQFSGTIKSSIGLGILLSEGIGDTMRVSLTADPVQEVKVAYEIQKSLGLREGLDIISCPTCARCETDLILLVEKTERLLKPYIMKPIKIAVMGCIVNGPGEAREADVGIAVGRGKGVLFKKGEVLKTVKDDDYLDELVHIVKEIL